MSARRGTKRPNTDGAESSLLWGRIVPSLHELAKVQSDQESHAAIHNFNKWCAKIPSENSFLRAAPERSEQANMKLRGALNKIQSAADAEETLITQILEDLSVLKALRSAPQDIHGEAPLWSFDAIYNGNVENRRKRQRLSPSVSSRGTPPVTTAPTRASTGGPQVKVKARKDNITQQLPLPEGRRVAYRQSRKEDGVEKLIKEETHRRRTTETPEPEPEDEDGEWIIAVVTKRGRKNPNVYTVQDAEPEDPKHPPTWTTTSRSLIPLPDPNASASSPAHFSAYGPFPAGATVLGHFPDTSAFYRAVVHQPPKPPATDKSVYKLKFEGDNDMIRDVSVHMVIPYPGP
ncbi:hypothetical protein CALVIDRAFT_536869 [Calocera viscosa TUFC12733]|uniref:SGF29 C-terminal domain-containing protein n=1 Tax=Calocera viscosa (strain TUFC12733) TaxID=1330018 RepID=A0A167MPU0_CALVF|nr:hypothetical protein CALVIDRAFT_536869 [Calocera viscosa TUFC12733]